MEGVRQIKDYNLGLIKYEQQYRYLQQVIQQHDQHFLTTKRILLNGLELNKVPQSELPLD